MYICHYCADYMSESQSDMSKHFKRIHKCKCATLYNYEDACLLSKQRKYIFMFDTENLSKADYIYIITHYLEKENKIPQNFKQSEYIVDQSKQEDGTYMCYNCKSIFTRKFSLMRHLRNKEICEKLKENNDILEKNNKMIHLIIEKEKQKNEEAKTFINTNNTQNINNIQNNNNNNNTHHNTYNLQIKDFIHENYDISHIKDDFYLKKDFFLYPNFLSVIMQNKKNHNIFFNENEAIIYTDKELNKMSSDKAGYLILDKLSQSFEQLLYRQDDETQKYYEYIQKYYHVIKGHFKHDTIGKEYNVDEKRFYYTANSNLFRSRDKYLNKITGVVNEYKNTIRENMMISIDQIKDIPTLNPNIEYYASTKMRYRDLKDKD